MDEFDLIAVIQSRTAQSRGDVRLSIGDDAALLTPPPGQQLVACTDTLVEGVHFPGGTAPDDLGWKSLAVNLSDLAAMGATPAWALLALTLPQADARYVERFADGFARLARQYKLALIGGDTTQGPLSITVSAFGFLPQDCALLRSGARTGDAVFVTGTLGDAAAALRCLDRNDPCADALLAAAANTREELLARLHRPQPRIAAGLALRGIASACIDVSDGLIADLAHVCGASGVGAELDADALPMSSALLELFETPDRREFTLSGGDDYELCFTAPVDRADRISADFSRLGCGATRIGRIVEQPGVRVHDAHGNPIDTPHRGWLHFDA
ncbi:MAG: thiamine-phosphate kinase [Rhodanobacteraceae bacterium]